MRRLLGLTLALSLLIPASSALAGSAPNSTPPSWVKSANVYEVNVRQYSSNSKLTSVTKDIPRLKKMGVKVLWLMPIFPIGVERRLGSLGSPYSIKDYKKVNPEFGTASDLKALVKAAHKAGLYVILDWVANHTSWDNSWITSHPDWYTQEGGEIISPKGTGWNDVADLNFDNQEMRAAMISAMKYWVTSFDVDGFRCDAAGMVPADFWDDAAVELAMSKKLFMLAEDGSSTALLEDAFNANYNWNLMGKLKSLGSGFGSQALLEGVIDQQSYTYPTGTYPLNFITNHDENSWNGTVQEFYGLAEDSMAVLTYTLPGMPLIYNGQEVGLNKRLEFFEKDPINWKAYGKKGAAKTLFYTNLNSLKLNNPALWTGSAGGAIKFIETDNFNVMAYLRYKGSNKVLTVVNLTSEKQTVNIPMTTGKLYKLGAAKPTVIGKNLKLTLTSSGYAVYSSKQ
jgi:glycosidase